MMVRVLRDCGYRTGEVPERDKLRPTGQPVWEAAMGGGEVWKTDWIGVVGLEVFRPLRWLQQCVQ